MANSRQASVTLRSNNFYRNSYNSVMAALALAVIILIVMAFVVLYQMLHKPLPRFAAASANGLTMQLSPHTDPNLLSTTLTTWASKAAVAAYTFDFVNYNKQIALARPYFTDSGWAAYLASIDPLIQTISQNQLFVNGVVSGAPVISNQGDLPGQGYTWRIQIPFLVTYQSANELSRRSFTVIVTIVRVPSNINPAGIGIDQFVMV